MARRRYGEVTSGSGKSHQGRRITMAQPVSSIIGDVVKSSRSIAHSDEQVSSRWAATGKQQQVSGSKQQQVAGKLQGSSRQAAGKQRASSRQAATSVCPVERMIKYILKNQRNKKIELFPGARPQNEEIVQLLKVVVMPKLNFFQAHGLPIRLLRADTT